MRIRGADNGVATTVATATTLRYVGGYPFGYWVPERKTMRGHYGQSAGPAYESAFLNVGYSRVACEGGNTYTDAELMLVSKPSGGANANVNWNIVSSD